MPRTCHPYGTAGFLLGKIPEKAFQEQGRGGVQLSLSGLGAGGGRDTLLPWGLRAALESGMNSEQYYAKT